MLENLHKTAQSPGGFEEHHSGVAISPPAFQLQASPATALAEESDESSPQSYTERVSNFPLIITGFKNAVQSRDSQWLLRSLEPLKHDPEEVAHFRVYFEEREGTSPEQYATDNWEEGAGEVVGTMLGTFKGDDVQGHVEDNLILAVREGNAEKVYTALNLLADPARVIAKYREQAPGRDLYTDIAALGTPENGVADLAADVFGRRQNFEKVQVKNEEEAREARLIIARIYEQYGLEVNSQRSLDAELEWAKAAPEELRKQIRTSTWTLPELRDLEKALGHYAPLLGDNRAKTDRANTPQEVESVGKLNKSIGLSRTNAFYTSENTGGEYLKASSSINLFDAMNETGYNNKYNTNGKNTASPRANVMTHELGHGLMEFLLPQFIRATKGYWKNATQPNPITKFTWAVKGQNHEYTRSNISGAEAPPVEYGAWNASEDLAESLALFFNNPGLLDSGSAEWNSLPFHLKKQGVVGNPCPSRKRFIQYHLKRYLDQAQ